MKWFHLITTKSGNSLSRIWGKSYFNWYSIKSGNNPSIFWGKSYQTFKFYKFLKQIQNFEPSSFKCVNKSWQFLLAIFIAVCQGFPLPNFILKLYKNSAFQHCFLQSYSQQWIRLNDNYAVLHNKELPSENATIAISQHLFKLFILDPSWGWDMISCSAVAAEQKQTTGCQQMRGVSQMCLG